MRSRSLLPLLWLGLLLALPAPAEEEPAATAPEAAAATGAAADDEAMGAADADDEAVDDEDAEQDEAADGEGEEDADQELQFRWSLTPTAVYTHTSSKEDANGVGGFLDQYDFVPNKSSTFPVELGVSGAALDVFGKGETPLLQVRFESPTSNLGVSGSQIDDPFYNQRLLVLGRLPGFDLDLFYRRIRTEETRLFPNTAGTGLLFEDMSAPDDRFARQRTGFAAELGVRPGELLPSAKRLDEVLAPELLLHGGYDHRSGRRQLRFLINPDNRWIGLAQDRDQNVGDVGGGLLMAPGRWFTADFDFDYQRFREDEPAILQSELGNGITPNASTVDFIPDTDRYTGTLRLRGRIGERATLEGGFQAAVLEQVPGYTPLQDAFGLRNNQIQFYSGNFTADVALVAGLSANAYFKYDQRHNDIDRNTALFNPDGNNGTQVDEFVRDWTRLRAGIEAAYRINAGNRLALGGRYDSVDRDLEFSSPGCPPGSCFPAILPVNALVHDDSRSYTVYGSTRLRLLQRVGVSGEVGYRIAPDLGYVTDLDDYLYGKLRASYTLPVEKSVVLSLFARGGRGENNDQVMVGGGGVGIPPTGPDLRRHFDRYDWLVGLTANAAPWEKVGVFGSFFVSSDVQDYELALSSLQRYVQPSVPITFRDDGDAGYDNRQWSVVVGTHVGIDDRTDASLAYAFTRAETGYDSGSPELALIHQNAKIDSNLHSANLEVGRWLREGLRVQVGYRFEYYQDGAYVPQSLVSAIPPFDLDSTRHTVTLGVTLTSALLEP